MGEELQRHDVLIDEVNTKMDSVTKELSNNNERLKGLVTKVRAAGRHPGPPLRRPLCARPSAAALTVRSLTRYRCGNHATSSSTSSLSAFCSASASTYGRSPADLIVC
jgi:hypothetical protein